MIEVYAACVAHSDHQIGRVIGALREMGQLDNTLVIFIQGDNGASAEGGPHGELNEAMFMNGLSEELPVLLQHIDKLGGPMAYNHYPVGWAHAMDAPFQWFKQVASHFGGTRNGLVMSWPQGIQARGDVRNQFHHVIDIAPTLLDILGLQAPAVVHGVPQLPMAGISMAYTFANADAPSARKKQYFELVGNRAIYHDGWVAASGPTELPWKFSMKPETIDSMTWELYHVAEDYSEAVEVSALYPQKLRELQDLFWIEAARHHALPIIRGIGNMPGPLRPSNVRGRTEFVFADGIRRVPPGSSPNLSNRSFRIEADVDLPAAGAQGVLFSQGGRFGGHALYVKDRRLVYHYNLLGRSREQVVSTHELPSGHQVLSIEFTSDGGGWGKGGEVRLYSDQMVVGQGRLSQTVPWVMSYVEGLNVGLDTGTPVSEDYKVPFRFNGTLHSVKVTLLAVAASF